MVKLKIVGNITSLNEEEKKEWEEFKKIVKQSAKVTDVARRAKLLSLALYLNNNTAYLVRLLDFTGVICEEDLAEITEE